MSESKPEMPDTGEGAPELTITSGPDQSGRAADPKVMKGGRRVSSSSDRQFKVERAQKCLENAVLVSKRIKEHRRATAELLGKTLEDDDTMDTSSDIASVSTRTGYSVATTDSAPPISVEDALNIPGISESLANTLKQKEILMERIKQYKEISKKDRPVVTKSAKKIMTPLMTSSLHEEQATNKQDFTKLQKMLKEKENTMSLMQVKMKAMETTIHDLQEKICEKDSLIEAKNKATFLMSDNLSKKEKDSINLLEDTRQQMVKMQENFVAMEAEWKQEKDRLLRDIETKNEKIMSLEEANAILENSRFEISLSHSKLSEEIEAKNKFISDLEEKLSNLSVEIPKTKDNISEEKGSQEISNMMEMTKKLELLEQLNCQIKQTNLELENKLATLNSPENKTPETSTPKKSSPQVTRKRGKSATRNTSAKLKSPWTALAESSSQDTQEKNQKYTGGNESEKTEMIIQSLNKELLEKEYSLLEKDALIKSQLETISQKEAEISSFKNDKPEYVDVAVVCDLVESKLKDSQFMSIEGDTNTELNNIDLDELQKQLTDAKNQIAALNLELELANKNMVKVKSAHKLKLKQMQKTIDNFSKMSDSNAEVSRLSEEVHNLTQKIAELEEDKGNLQLHLVDYDSGRLNESELSRRLVQLESLAEARLKSIADLETQKFDLVQELHVLQQRNSELEDKLTDLQQLYSEHVSTEIKSVQLEEQLDKAAAGRNELELIVEHLKLENQQLNKFLKELQDKNTELTNKLDIFVQENMDLTDRLEKLSAGKVSSAESIEMVESLTAQEKLELEEYNKNIIAASENLNSPNNTSSTTLVTDVINKTDIGENLIKLSQESEELNKKIELFTQERHEVMEKMSKQKSENEELISRLEKIELLKTDLECQLESVLIEKKELLQLNDDLTMQIENLKIEQVEMNRENTRKKSSEETSVEGESPPKETSENIQVDSANSDDKPQVPKTKHPKQMTKEILKLKNIIKEREAEIADCQMKILSLEERLVKSATMMEHTIKILTDENNNLKDEIALLKIQIESSVNNQVDIESLKQINEELKTLTSDKDAKINELEQIVCEYDQKIIVYNNKLQEKEKDISEYLNQISQLNSVSQKLKSTVELLEEEKLKDQNADTVKHLNVQLVNFQNLIGEQEKKLKFLDEEKNHLLAIKSDLIERNSSLENDIQKLYNTLLEKDIRMKDLQDLKNRHDEEISKIMTQCSEKDEEIHEIKLELRKESIENENLRKSNNEFTILISNYITEIDSLKKECNDINEKNSELGENITTLETKNKELMEKLKKFAVNLKKKSNMCAEFENEVRSLKLEIEKKQEILDACNIQMMSLNKEIECSTSSNISTDKNKIKELENQINTLNQEKICLMEQFKDLENDHILSKNELESLLANNASLNNELQNQKYKALQLQTNIDFLQNRSQEYEQTISTNSILNNKITELEQDVTRKQEQIMNLLADIEKIQDELNTFKFGQEAKIQERDLFIENLESEISNYRGRIARLEESISVMEDRRHSLERKADQLGSQLEEKQKSYRQYSSHEDELVNRLAVLMEHDQVVEKRLKEIEKENVELNNKIHTLCEDNKCLRDFISQSNEEYCNFKEQSNQVHQEELELSKHNIAELEQQIKQMYVDHQAIVKKQQEDIQNLESEFHNQIEINIKEKKCVIEKYEKEKELKDQLEVELKQHIDHVKTLSTNLQELHLMNFDLQNRTSNLQNNDNDYTEQYVSEINKLQATINENNLHITGIQKSKFELENKISSLESELSIARQILADKNNEIESVNHDLEASKKEAETLKIYLDDLKVLVQELQQKLKNSDRQESLIEIHNFEKEQTFTVSGEMQNISVQEEVIIPKKAYLCYDKSIQRLPASDVGQEDTHSEDPFNSEEGWGLGEKSLEYEEVKEQNTSTKLQMFIKENESLKTDLQNVNTKLTKAMKKLKELKMSNEKLSSELKQVNNLAEMNLLDNTIEEELKMQIKTLEKELQVLSSDLKKEKGEKEAISKQNEILKDANDRFLEMKEKLENDVVMWKYKCKEITDKLSSLEWDEQQMETTPKQKTVNLQSESSDNLKSLLEQVEKENDDLNLLVDELKKENMTLVVLQSKQMEEFIVLQNELSKLKTNIDMKTIVEQTENKNIELNFIVEELKKDNVNLTSLNSKQKEEIDTLSSSLSTVKTDLERGNHQLKELKKELQFLSENHLAVIQEKDNLNSMLTELRNEHQKLRDAYDNLNNINNKLGIIAEESKKECAVLRDSNLTLETELTSLRENVTKHAEVPVGSKTTETFLEESLRNLKIEFDKSLIKIDELQKELLTTYDKAALFEKKAIEFEENYMKLNLEKDQLLSTMTELQTSISSAVDQRGYEVAEMWKQHLAQRESDFSSVEHELRDQISSLENKYENLLDNVQSSSQEETNKMIEIEQVSSLQTKLKDKEDHLISLQNQYSDLVSQMQMLRAEMENEKIINENKLLDQQEDYERQVVEVRNKEIEKDTVITELNLKLKYREEANETISTELNELKVLVDSLKSNITELTCQLHQKDNEIFLKTQEFNIVLNQRNEEFEHLRLKLIEYEKKIEDLTFEKESDLAVMRLKLHEQTTEYELNQSKLQSTNNELVESLANKIEECTILNKKINDLNKSLQEDSHIMSEMKIALESQELEIVTLKDELDKLQILLESSTAKITKHVTFSTDTKPGPESADDGGRSTSETVEMVPKPELDLALYMLYQRNIRCEELTMELSSLLEERDTLQLRLSDSLRTYEELRRKLEASGIETGVEVKASDPNERQSVNVSEVATTSRSSMGEAEILETKLSELRSVRHSRDVRLRQDSERRELDMQLLNRDVARLPAEAADQLRQAHYTLSRDSQSTSSVILNWLMGRETPKSVQNL